jgi:hypothetical protein
MNRQDSIENAHLTSPWHRQEFVLSCRDGITELSSSGRTFTQLPRQQHAPTRRETDYSIPSENRVNATALLDRVRSFGGVPNHGLEPHLHTVCVPAAPLTPVRGSRRKNSIVKFSRLAAGQRMGCKEQAR